MSPLTDCGKENGEDTVIGESRFIKWFTVFFNSFLIVLIFEAGVEVIFEKNNCSDFIRAFLNLSNYDFCSKTM